MTGGVVRTRVRGAEKYLKDPHCCHVHHRSIQRLAVDPEGAIKNP